MDRRTEWQEWLTLHTLLQPCLLLSTTGHTHRTQHANSDCHLHNVKQQFSTSTGSAPAWRRPGTASLLRSHPSSIQQRDKLPSHLTMMSLGIALVLFGPATSDLSHVRLSPVLHWVSTGPFVRTCCVPSVSNGQILQCLQVCRLFATPKFDTNYHASVLSPDGPSDLLIIQEFIRRHK